MTLVSGAANCTIQATQAGNADYAAAPAVSRSFWVYKEAQTITFADPGTQTVGTPLTLSAKASSGLAVTFTSTTTGVCTVSGTTATFIASGTCTIDANQAGNSDDYLAAPTVAQSFTVKGKAQTITFATLPNQTYGAAPFTVSATASSGLPVSFASTTSGVCTVSSTVSSSTVTTVTLVAGDGTCTIEATQAGNADYAAAPAVSRSFWVNREAQTITFANPGTQTVGTPLALSAKASSGLAVTFTSTTTGVCTVSGTTATFIASGTCTIDANQAGNSDDYLAAPTVAQSFTVKGKAQTITFAALPTRTYGAAPFTVSATASSGLPVSFTSTTTSVCTVSGSTVTLVSGAANCTIEATQAGNADYAAAPAVSQSFWVYKEAQTITFANPGSQTVGTPLVLSAKASSGLAVTFTSTTTGICTVSGTTATFIASGTCTIDANQAGNSDDYLAAPTVAQSFTVKGEAQTITFANPGTQTVGTPLTLSATASSGLAVTFTSTTTGICTVSGTTATFIASGTCTIDANQAGNSTYAAAPQVQQSFTVNPAGSQVSGTVFLNNYCSNGNSNLPVTFTVGLYNGSTLEQSTTTASDGAYSFTSVPNGTYSIKPSLPGAATLFYPTGYTGVVLNSATNSNVTGENFNANVGFTVTGNVSYSGSQTGQTYIYLNNTNCGGGSGGPGTSITEATLKAGGAFTVRGVPPGSYSLGAYMDPIGQEQRNAIDPTGSSVVSVTDGNSTDDVTMTDPVFATPSENPTISTIIPNSQGVVIEGSQSKNSNGVEDANEYTVQWSTSPTLGGGTGGGQFATIAGSHTFTASGKNGIWILNDAVLSGSGYSFTSGQTYYFQARSFDTLDTSNPHPTGWCNYTSSGCSGTSGFIGVKIGTPACPPTAPCTAVSSSVTIPAGIIINSGAPLYLGLVQLTGAGGSPTGIYVTEIANPVNGVNDFPEPITVPSGSDYAVVGILDQDKTGGIGVGTINNTRNNLPANLTISGTSQTAPGITLSAANSTALATTQWSSNSCDGCGAATTSYQLDFEVLESDKLPVAVTITSGPNLINTSGTVALDMSGCTDCGNPKFQYSTTLPGGAPKVGDTYDFTVTYSDGTQDTGSTVNGAVTSWNGGSTIVGASDAPTNLAPNDNSSTSTTPTFTWTDSSSATGSVFNYSFYMNQATPCCYAIWQIPGQNSKANGFSSSITSITWGIDPTDSSNTPSVGSLTPGYAYQWQIYVNDLNGNQATTTVWYQP